MTFTEWYQEKVAEDNSILLTDWQLGFIQALEENVNMTAFGRRWGRTTAIKVYAQYLEETKLRD